jgi:hypothetical protein
MCKRNGTHSSVMTLEARRTGNGDDGNLVMPRDIHDADDILRAHGLDNDCMREGGEIGIL